MADLGHNRIQKFPPNSDSGTNAVTVAGGNGAGNAANQLYNPYGIFIDKSGYLYVADGYNNRIRKFPPGSDSTTNGVTVAGDSVAGNGADQLTEPYSIYVDNNYAIYVADEENRRIQKFPSGSAAETNSITIAGALVLVVLLPTTNLIHMEFPLTTQEIFMFQMPMLTGF